MLGDDHRTKCESHLTISECARVQETAGPEFLLERRADMMHVRPSAIGTCKVAAASPNECSVIGDVLLLVLVILG